VLVFGWGGMPGWFTNARPELSEADRQERAYLEEIGSARLDAAAHRAWIDAESWRTLDVQQKEALSERLAYWTEVETGSRWVDLHDKTTGEELASFSSSSGCKLY